MDLRKPLAILCVLAFVILLLWSNSRRRLYVLYVLFALPLMDFQITPSAQGGFTVFDAISYFSLIFIIKDFRFTTNQNAGYFVIFLLLAFVLTLGSVESEFVHTSLISLSQFFPIFIFTKSVMDEINEEPDFTQRIIHASRVICLVSVVFLMCQIVLGLKFSLYPGLNTNTFVGDSARYPSFFNDPQKYAQYLSMSSFLFLIPTNSLSILNRKRYLFFGAVIIAMFLTGARAAFSGLVIGLAIVYLIGESKYRTAGIVAGVFGYIIILLFGQYFPLFNRGESYSESYEFRNQIWKEALQIYRANSLLGIGIGNYQSYVALYSPDQFWFMPEGEIMYFDHPESGYLKMLTEYGTFAFILICSFVIIPIFAAVRNFLNHFTDNRIFYFIGAITGWLISYITVYSLSDRRVLILVGLNIILLIMASNGKLETLYESENS